ncbi:MAG: hypothetical protein KDD69_06145 [Bdellovibrionales bacterium]|nr:hypothetical protein [Bdellovibrionales bacterium]
MAALSEFGLPGEQLHEELFAVEGNFFKVGRPPWRVDLMTSLRGVSFAQMYPNRIQIMMGPHPLSLVSKPDLIRIKELAGRPQDLLDVERLQRTPQN